MANRRTPYRMRSDYSRLGATRSTNNNLFHEEPERRPSANLLLHPKTVVVVSLDEMRVLLAKQPVKQGIMKQIPVNAEPGSAARDRRQTVSPHPAPYFEPTVVVIIRHAPRPEGSPIPANQREWKVQNPPESGHPDILSLLHRIPFPTNQMQRLKHWSSHRVSVSSFCFSFLCSRMQI